MHMGQLVVLGCLAHVKSMFTKNGKNYITTTLLPKHLWQNEMHLIFTNSQFIPKNKVEGPSVYFGRERRQCQFFY